MYTLPFLFIFRVDWIMKNVVSEKRKIQWTLSTISDDLDFIDDSIALTY